MGNGVSVNLRIKLDNDPRDVAGRIRSSRDLLLGESFQAGTSVQGEVLMEIEEGGSRWLGGGGTLMLYVVGTERTAIATGKKSSSRVNRKERVFYQSSTKLCQWTFGRRRGRYEFPFSITLPDSLPSTFSHGSERHGCQIVYSLRTCFRKNEISRPFRVVSAPLPNVTVPCFLEPQTESIKTLGVRKRGSITFGAGVHDTHVGKGQELELSLACRNNSAVDIRHVNIKLVELVTWHANSQKMQEKNVLVLMQDLDLPGLMKGALGNNGYTDASQNYTAIYNALRSRDNMIHVPVPTSAQDTYMGRLLHVSHYIKIYLNTPRFAQNISKKIPLQVGNASVEIASEAPQPPPLVGPFFIPPDEPALAEPVSPTAPVEEEFPVSFAPSAPTEDDLFNQHIPFASAVPIPLESNVQTPIVEVPGEAVVLGGYEHSGEFTDFDGVVHLVSAPAPPRPSFSGLLEEMSRSVNDFDIISDKLRDEDWRRVLEALNPKQFGQIIAGVSMEFDQIRVAQLLAPHIQNRGNGFVCEYCVSALQKTASWNRIAMAQRLLQYCRDLQRNHILIQSELTEWERTVTKREFQTALRNRGSRQ